MMPHTCTMALNVLGMPPLCWVVYQPVALQLMCDQVDECTLVSVQMAPKIEVLGDAVKSLRVVVILLEDGYWNKCWALVGHLVRKDSPVALGHDGVTDAAPCIMYSQQILRELILV